MTLASPQNPTSATVRISLASGDSLTTPSLPASKSLANRALLLSAMAQGTSVLRGELAGDDVEIMLACLRSLGVNIVCSPMETLVTGQPFGFRSTRTIACVDVGTAGTVARMLTAVLATMALTVRIDGSTRMRERPMEPLLSALAQQGAQISYWSNLGWLPCELQGTAAFSGGDIFLPALTSSQFVSALVLAASRAQAPTRLLLADEPPSLPYINMTRELLRRFGGNAEWVQPNQLRIEPANLVAQTIHLEPDASAASYFLALAAADPGRSVRIHEIGAESLQGDAAFVRVLAAMGAQVEQTAQTTLVRGGSRLCGIQADLRELPDVAPTLATLALLAEGPTEIRGVEVLKHHESDRLHAVATELRKFGASVETHQDGWTITPGMAPRTWPLTHIDTYNDHRIAMAFAILGNVVIENPGCVNKTFPGFWRELAASGADVQFS